jgi:hypothetical protein
LAIAFRATSIACSIVVAGAFLPEIHQQAGFEEVV